MCRSTVQCSAQLTPEEADGKGCSIQGGVLGVCCKEISVLGTNQATLVSPKVGIRRIRQVDNDELRKAIQDGDTSYQKAFQKTTQMNTIRNSQSTSGQYAMFVQASPEVIRLKLERNGMVAMEAARRLAFNNNRKLFFHWIEYLITPLAFLVSDYTPVLLRATSLIIRSQY